jgi:hypothetical protein
MIHWRASFARVSLGHPTYCGTSLRISLTAKNTKPGRPVSPVQAWHTYEERLPPMKKPVKRASLLEHVLSDFLEVEDILLKLELKGELQPLTARQTRLYKEVIERLHELVRDLTHDVAREHRAA